MLVAAGEALAADPRGARSLCRKALSLWRGPTFGERADEEFLQVEAARLEERTRHSLKP